MPRVHLTGMSGAGKTTLLYGLRRRAHLTVDTGYDGWELPDATWDEDRMAALLAAAPDVVVSGTVSNQGRFLRPVRARRAAQCPGGRAPRAGAAAYEQPVRDNPAAAGRIAEYTRTVEPRLRAGATVELDGRRPVTELADVVEALVRR